MSTQKSNLSFLKDGEDWVGQMLHQEDAPSAISACPTLLVMLGGTGAETEGPRTAPEVGRRRCTPNSGRGYR